MKTMRICKKQKKEAKLENQRQKAFIKTSVYHWEVYPILHILSKLETRFESAIRRCCMCFNKSCCYCSLKYVSKARWEPEKVTLCFHIVDKFTEEM